MSSTDGKTWAEVPHWSWKGMDGHWYMFDEKWALWWTKDGKTWVKVPTNNWR